MWAPEVGELGRNPLTVRAGSAAAGRPVYSGCRVPQVDVVLSSLCVCQEHALMTVGQSAGQVLGHTFFQSACPHASLVPAAMPWQEAGDVP